MNNRFEAAPPTDILRWAVQQFWPDVAASSSFQTQGVPLLHLIAQTAVELPIIFLDTGYHFPETLLFRDRLVAHWGLTVRVARAGVVKGRAPVAPQAQLYRTDPDRCCYLNKVEPMQQATAPLTAWISGIRRDQSPTRANIKIVERLPGGLIRIHPLATWSRKDIWRYMHDHNLPEHPLMGQGYLSIGCAPCTRPVFDGDDERAGRWAGHTKTECGLHTVLRQPETVQVQPDSNEMKHE